MKRLKKQPKNSSLEQPVLAVALNNKLKDIDLALSMVQVAKHLLFPGEGYGLAADALFSALLAAQDELVDYRGFVLNESLVISPKEGRSDD